MRGLFSKPDRKTARLVSSGGFTFIEVSIILAVISILFIGIVSAFSYITSSLQYSKQRTLVNNFAQEKIEALKSLSYARLLTTSQADLDSFGYDNTNAEYKPETITVSSVHYTRYTTVYKAKEVAIATGTAVVTLPPSSQDEGLKEIKIEVRWSAGGAQKSMVLYNLQENPNREMYLGGLYGFVTSTDTSIRISGAVVEIAQNLNWNALTSATGYYIIRTTTPASLQARVSKDAYFTTISSNIAVSNTPAMLNIQLTKKLLGTVTGWVCLNDHLVISLVASATDYHGYEQEFVQLYNPTTWFFTINDANIRLYRVDNNDNRTKFNLTYATTTLSPYSYYLIANVATVHIGTGSVAADATYAFYMIQESNPGGIGLCNAFDVWIDSVGWGKTPGYGQKPPQTVSEGFGWHTSGSDPIEPGYYLQRIKYADSSMGSTNTVRGGGAYDTNYSSNDFLYVPIALGSLPPYNSASYLEPTSGKPAYGAVIGSNDSLASRTTAYFKLAGGTKGNAYFSINVSTGTWSIFITSNSYYKEIANVTVTQNQTTAIPNAGTAPAWQSSGRNIVVLSSPSVGGVITGKVIRGDSFAAVQGIQVTAGINTTNTDASGNYLFNIEEGSYVVTANAGYNSSSWTQAVETIGVRINQVANVPDLVIYPAGWISGATKNATGSPLPYVTVAATVPLVNFAKDTVSDSGGLYILKGVRTGACYVYPVLDAKDYYSSDKAYPITITQGAENTGNNFTITSSWGKIRGTVKSGANSITTGVLVLATTGPVPSDPPPVIDSALRAGNIIYYGTVSLSDGTYEIEVRKGWTYNIRAWFTAINSDETLALPPSKTATSSAVTDLSSPVTVNFSWP